MNGFRLISAGTAALLGLSMSLAPSLTPRRYYFGLTVAPEFRRSETGRAIHQQFLFFTIAATLISVLLDLFLPAAPILLVTIALVPAAGAAAFYYARGRVRNFAAPPRAIREAEVSRAPERLPRWSLLSLPPFAILLGVALYLRSNWDRIPARFPVHWGMNGEPNRWATRTVRGVYGPIGFGGIILIALLAMAIAGFYGSRRSPLRLILMKAMLGVMYVIALSFGMAALLPLRFWPPGTMVWPILAFAAVLILWVAKLNAEPGIPDDATPDACWHLSIIYYNRSDPALFVQRRIGFGYTLNFGNPAAWIFIGVLLAIVPAAIFLLR